MLAIPLLNQPRQRFDVLLNGQQAGIEIWWQPLSAAWYLSLSVGGDPIAAGRQVAPWQPLVQSDGFNGDLMAVSNPGHETANPGRDAWGDDTHRLVYLTPAQFDRLTMSGALL